MTKHKSRRTKGHGVIEDIDKFLKKTKVISNIGQVALPAAGTALAGLFTANPLGAAAGGVAGRSLNEFLKSKGYGNMKGMGYTNKPLMLGSGMTYARNGVYQQIPGTMRGLGGTAWYGLLRIWENPSIISLIINDAVYNQTGQVRFQSL